MAQPTIKRAWWKESSVYQIYPASFKDTNGDGVGDIPGIISKLDYIKALGIDIIWSCPIYKSPQVDMGYDISDYKDIHAPYGTVADVEKLIEGCHSRGMKFLMDLVVNHTSDQVMIPAYHVHKWFQEAKSSKDNPYRDWYIWKKPKYDADGKRQPPNNWGAVWGGSAWEYDEASDEYYLHIFAPEQPDLNWEHPPVRDAVHDIMRFWLDKGADGFRLDVINFISKVPGLPDAPITRKDQVYQPGDKYFACGPRLHEYLLQLGNILKQYNAFSVGEMPSVQDPKEILNAVAYDRGELNMIFNFEIVDMDIGDEGKFSRRPWTMSKLKGIVDKWQNFMINNDGWNSLYIENHDQSRSVSRWGSDLPEFRTLAAKMFATFLALQSGTVFVYQGQEIGMINIPIERPVTEYKDLETLNAWKELLERYPNDKERQRITHEEIQLKSRDNARTPMQWDTSKYAGFSTAEPWQRENESYHDINAESQVGVKGSVFQYWASILALRKAHKDIFIYGNFKLLDVDHEDVFAYTRTFEGKTVVVVTNFRKTPVKWSLPENITLQQAEVLVSNYDGVSVADGTASLRPFEAFAAFVD
ncbi:Alpha-glucosidase [Lachnellula cervina]|uniref:Alpha-glucosidase n=1 Tax=Lachnellula cervina TaxID=1316786 RepID=A0A7D8UXU6_9HELO|nr:Alpha-glucosidase [Lachnellula cervina]